MDDKVDLKQYVEAIRKKHASMGEVGMSQGMGEVGACLVLIDRLRAERDALAEELERWKHEANARLVDAEGITRGLKIEAARADKMAAVVRDGAKLAADLIDERDALAAELKKEQTLRLRAEGTPQGVAFWQQRADALAADEGDKDGDSPPGCTNCDGYGVLGSMARGRSYDCHRCEGTGVAPEHEVAEYEKAKGGGE